VGDDVSSIAARVRVPPQSPEGVPRGAPELRSCGRLQEISHPEEVVRRRPEEEDPVHQGRAAVAELPELPDGLQPPEDLLDALPAPLAEGVPRVAGGPAIDGAAVVGMLVLRDVGCDLEIPAALDEVRGVIPIVAPERRAARPVGSRWRR